MRGPSCFDLGQRHAYRPGPELRRLERPCPAQLGSLPLSQGVTVYCGVDVSFSSLEARTRAQEGPAILAIKLTNCKKKAE